MIVGYGCSAQSQSIHAQVACLLSGLRVLLAAVIWLIEASLPELGREATIIRVNMRVQFGNNAAFIGAKPLNSMDFG